MNIQKTLSEIYRVLVPGGSVSLKPASSQFSRLLNFYTKPSQIRPHGFSSLRSGEWPMVPRYWQDCWFLKRPDRSFQTERGMKIAMNRAGFVDLSFRRAAGPAGGTFAVEARKSKVIDPSTAVSRPLERGWHSFAPSLHPAVAFTSSRPQTHLRDSWW